MNALAYSVLAGAVFWIVLALLAPTVAAAVLIGGAVGLVLAATLPRADRQNERVD